MTCPATLGDSEGLCCVRTDEHTTGHIFHSSTGSEVPDRHDATSGGEH